MPKCYIIIRGWGEYSDRGIELQKVYLDKIKAQKIMAALEEIEERTNKIVNAVSGIPIKRFEYRNTIAAKVRAEYAAIGFEAGPYDDWQLEEAEFVG